MCVSLCLCVSHHTGCGVDVQLQYFMVNGHEWQTDGVILCVSHTEKLCMTSAG